MLVRRSCRALEAVIYERHLPALVRFARASSGLPTRCRLPTCPTPQRSRNRRAGLLVPRGSRSRPTRVVIFAGCEETRR